MRQRERGDLSATDYEISIVRKNGEIRHLQVFRKEVLWDDVRQFQVICNDITERKHAEKEIRKSAKLLENLHTHLNEILENERAMISREIHDQIGQSLTALKLDLNRIHKYVGTNPEAIMKLDSMIELVSNTIKDVQRISSDLRPGILDDLGLVSAIEWYCEEFEKRTGIKCDQKLENSDYSDSQINLTFFRVLQETLTNVIRHARASSVNIRLYKSSKGAILTIADNGIGILEEKIESHKSLGLISMRERVRQFNGKINISSKKGEGTKLTIFIPSK
jgi:signal transduction histidine kinase